MAADRVYRSNFPGLEISRGGFGEDALIGLYHSSKIPTPQNNYTSGNNPRFSNPQWDALIDRYAVTVPYEERMQVMTDIIVFLMDELMYQPLFFDTLVVPVSTRLLNAGVPRGGQRANQGWNAWTWDVK